MPETIKRPLTSLRWVTTEELAERWHIQIATVRGMIRDGRIPGKKIGEKMWIIPADVQYPDRRKRGKINDAMREDTPAP